MTSFELRKKFLEFFEKNGHAIVPSSSLLPTDPSVLFTTAGMQQFKEYYLGKPSPYGKNVASCQKSFRTSDIEEVGDERHLTFFEMLGNFSFGGYFKEEAIPFAKKFLDSVEIKIDYVTVFGGDKEVPRDEESVAIWGKLGFSEEKGNLRFFGREDNFWGPTGEEGPCGPTTEIYADGIEVWNIVFNQYYCYKDKRLEKLQMPGVDTGMGLERLAKVSQGVKTVFETDLFLPIAKLIPAEIKIDDKIKRILVDHARAMAFLISEGVRPSNKEQGYILRRIIRRAVVYEYLNSAHLADAKKRFLDDLLKGVVENYAGVYPELNLDIIYDEFSKERNKFLETIQFGIKEYLKLKDIDAKSAFKLYESFGLPFGFIKELDPNKTKSLKQEDFDKEFQKHQEISRRGLDQKFKGGLLDHSEETTKLHTATHILNEVLRKVVSPDIRQKGSNITKERLRFDFNFDRKFTQDEIKEVENKVNEIIGQDLEVSKEEMPLEEALKSGAQAEFGVKYPKVVSVYKIGNFSKEICLGPHAKRTSELGKFKIIKEESSGAGIRRIKAILE